MKDPSVRAQCRIEVALVTISHLQTAVSLRVPRVPHISASPFFSAIVCLGYISRIVRGQLSDLDSQGLNQATFKGRVERHFDPVKADGGAPPLKSWESWHRNMPACTWRPP